MPRFLIEVPHDPDPLGCAQVVHVFLTSGSHFLTNADWGCQDDHHCAWLVVDVDTRADARAIVPPAFRRQATIVTLNKFSLEEAEQLLSQHIGGSADWEEAGARKR